MRLEPLSLFLLLNCWGRPMGAVSSRADDSLFSILPFPFPFPFPFPMF
jgi:hypothetical protein